ncbi:hypothetical protein [Streptomyces sp. UNOB3_S3]|uniref:hypothetical protein n=1 Tax=Streptomyces sp. UNOB3_S3 TaxID=2871682 RepID=UPI001E577CBD|nr:hypothetical protein [Streptomyces sp. UNOB3_S3]MCC3779260.1 hypothetical protein [Streptomyces sp. UNOB3_S3]
MTHASPARRAAARALTVCAVLLGLFLMHGNPAAAIDGCHGGMSAPASASMPMATQPAGHIPASAAGHDHHQSSDTSPAHASAKPDMPMMAGALCTSTPARDQAKLATAGPLMLLAFVIFGGWQQAGRLRACRAQRRGPPRSGRNLLLQVCVART